MGKTIWIDIDNPPQVQYLLPFKTELEKKGFKVLITARNYGITFELLKDKDIDFIPIGKIFPKQTIKKIFGLVKRTNDLIKHISKKNIAFVISSSRSSALAARIKNIPCFIICDYEYSELKFYKMMKANIIFPEVIPHNFFQEKGFDKNRRIGFKGLKEDISFYSIDVDNILPYDFKINSNFVKVLFRPPAETSHYYNSKSGNICLDLLHFLSLKENIKLIYSPRYDFQKKYIHELKWVNEPYVIKKPIEFVSLLKSVDLVISSGGTMLREAAHLDIPSYSIFQSEIGAVDKYLESQGRLNFIKSKNDFNNIIFKKKIITPRPSANSNATNEIIEKILNTLK